MLFFCIETDCKWNHKTPEHKQCSDKVMTHNVLFSYRVEYFEYAIYVFTALLLFRVINDEVYIFAFLWLQMIDDIERQGR